MQIQGPAPSPLPAANALARRAPADRADRATDGGSPDGSRPAAAEPSLWDLLTPEEREFFARAAELGPLTYRPGGASPNHAPVPTGQRIDVRG